MITIDVATDPPGGMVTLDGTELGAASFKLEVDFISEERSIDDFRAECIQSGAVSCTWDVLKSWLESKFVASVWWDLTFDERYSIAHMATSNVMRFLIMYFKRDTGCGYGEHTYDGECSSNTTIRCVKFGSMKGCMQESGLCSWKKNGADVWHNYSDEKNYNIPCFFVGHVTHVMAGIALNEVVTTLDDIFIFQYSEIDIQPGSLQLPYGKPIEVTTPNDMGCVGKISGTVVATIDVIRPMTTVDFFREECLADGSVICDWDTLRGWLESKQVGEVWWELTFDERYSIAHMATSNVMNFLVQYCKRDPGCGYGAHTHDGECSSNTAIRLSKFDKIRGCITESGLCSWKRYDDDEWHNYSDEKNYNIPCFLISTLPPIGLSHAMPAIALNETITALDDLFIFQYDDIDIKHGNWQLPHGSILKVLYPNEIACTGVTNTELITTMNDEE